jgi:hypothetical protein
MYPAEESIYRSWYSTWLGAGQPRRRNSSPSRCKIFLVYTQSKLLPGLIQFLSSNYGGIFPWGRAAGLEADHLPPTVTNESQSQYPFPPYIFTA